MAFLKNTSLNTENIKKTKKASLRLISDYEINETELNKILKIHKIKITKEAKLTLLNCANIDEFFLNHLHRHQIIDDNTYKKFIDAIQINN